MDLCPPPRSASPGGGPVTRPDGRRATRWPDDDAPLVEWALAAAARGFAVFRLEPGGNQPYRKGWQDEAAALPDSVRRLWKAHPRCNVGLYTAAHFVADVDVPRGGDGSKHPPSNGYPGWGRLLAEHGPLPETLVFATGGYGEHHVYSNPGGLRLRNTTNLAGYENVDVRAQGGYIVGPGSVHHQTKRRYTVLHDRPIAPVPDALVALLKPPAGGRGAGGGRIPSLAELLADPPAEGGRNDWFFQVCSWLAAEHRGKPKKYEGAWVKAWLGLPADVKGLDNPNREKRFDLDEAKKAAESVLETDRRNHPPGEPSPRPPSQATQLVDLALERYDLARSDDDELYAVPRDGLRRAEPLVGGGRLVEGLLKAYRDAHGKVAGSSAAAEAVGTLRGEAFDSERQAVHLRVGGHGEETVIDLGTAGGEVVLLRPGSWEVASESPVLFRRTRLTGAHPAPARGGDVDALRSILNVTDESWDLLVAYLVAGLLPDLAHPVLWLTGEQGTGKTTAMNRVQALLDPSPAKSRSVPRSVGDWASGCYGSWVYPLDNLSGIAPWLSDAVCKAVTGDSLVSRKLYTDHELEVVTFRRVVLLNGIDVGALRGDLGDRLVPIELDRIPDEQRLGETEVDDTFGRALPGVLGGLLDLAAEALKVLPDVDLAEKPRMADFAEVCEAVDRVRGTASLRTYLGTRDLIADHVVGADPVASAVVDLLDLASGGEWEGTWAELLHQLDRRKPEGVPRNSWPGTPSQLGTALRRSGPALRRQRVGVTKRSSHGRRLIALYRDGPSRLDLGEGDG